MGVPSTYPNPDPISDQRMSFSTSVFRPGLCCSKRGKDNPGVFTAKFEFRYKSLKSKFSFIPLVCILVNGCSKKNGENYPREGF